MNQYDLRNRKRAANQIGRLNVESNPLVPKFKDLPTLDVATAISNMPQQPLEPWEIAASEKAPMPKINAADALADPNTVVTRNGKPIPGQTLATPKNNMVDFNPAAPTPQAPAAAALGENVPAVLGSMDNQNPFIPNPETKKSTWESIFDSGKKLAKGISEMIEQPGGRKLLAEMGMAFTANNPNSATFQIGRALSQNLQGEVDANFAGRILAGEAPNDIKGWDVYGANTMQAMQIANQTTQAQSQRLQSDAAKLKASADLAKSLGTDMGVYKQAQEDILPRLINSVMAGLDENNPQRARLVRALETISDPWTSVDRKLAVLKEASPELQSRYFSDLNQIMALVSMGRPYADVVDMYYKNVVQSAPQQQTQQSPQQAPQQQQAPQKIVPTADERKAIVNALAGKPNGATARVKIGGVEVTIRNNNGIPEVVQ